MDMDDITLYNWLSQNPTELVNAIAQVSCDHISTLNFQEIDFYGYALLPGEPYDINRLVAVFNCESDVKVSPEHDDYRYYKYCVDEWSHWQMDGFDTINKLLREANVEFSTMHTTDRDNYQMDECEILYSNKLLEAITQGLEIAKENGVFGAKNPFLVVWISDSDHEIINKSVYRLNCESVARDFMEELG
jgi:hypothetical protein